MSVSDSNNNSLPVVFRSQVAPEKSIYKYRPTLRYDFFYACAYCSMSEFEASAVGFQIDHYLPESKHPELKHAYSNLMWSCATCNGMKSDFEPTNDDRDKGLYIIRIDNEDPSEHIASDEYRVVGKTSTGSFNIDVLHLNRSALIRIREIRQKYWRSKEVVLQGLRTLAKVSIDSLPPSLRGRFLSQRKSLSERATGLTEGLTDWIRDKCRSHLLDPDPNQSELKKARKAQLAKAGAIGLPKK